MSVSVTFSAYVYIYIYGRPSNVGPGLNRQTFQCGGRAKHLKQANVTQNRQILSKQAKINFKSFTANDS